MYGGTRSTWAGKHLYKFTLCGRTVFYMLGDYFLAEESKYLCLIHVIHMSQCTPSCSMSIEFFLLFFVICKPSSI